MWTGAKSVELGLADGFGTVESVARDVVKAEDIRDYTRNRISRAFAKRFGTDMAQSLMNSLAKTSLR
jgi:protease-4